MSATETEPKCKETEKLPLHQINPSYTVRVICCVFFIFLTEICLAHYVYRLITSEIRSSYVAKEEFHQYFLNEIRNEMGRDELARIFKEFEYSVRNVSSRKKRSAANNGLNYNRLNSPVEEPHVEFFNPKLRSDLEEKDEEIRRQTGNKGAAPGGDSWIWVTSSSRIPQKALEGYCQKVQQLCPPAKPGPIGPTGFPGEKGDRGDRGERGFPGIPGQMGARGNHGEKGEKGEQGRPGLNGRDGIPGEPGLDGLPGRNGHDGIPGIDGLPGLGGVPGIDGMKGDQGPPGPQGPQGPKGLTGPRGRPGKPGNHGTPGIPGITAWKTSDRFNVSKFLMAPTIAGAQSGPMGPIVVHEGENVRLHCSATGAPEPRITWQRVDNRPINRGAWQDIQISGATLNITMVNRAHMGLYLCIADNGVPPQSNQTFNLEVYFPPLVRISNQMVGVANGSTAILECETEAFPEPVRYWERSDGRLLENGDKYRIDNSLEKDGYKARMQLNITRITAIDYAYLYHCISKNELQTTKGEFTIYEIDPRLSPPPRMPSRGKETVFGVLPPKKVSMEDICGPPIQCPECDTKEPLKCSPSGVSLIDLVTRWEIRPFGNKVYPGYPNRSTDCVLYAVGKPVYHRFTDHTYGCWMRDPNAPNDSKNAERFWVTNEDQPTVLFEYDNKTMFRRDEWSKIYNLTQPFGGNTHVIYNGYFFYNEKNTNRVIKFHLHNQNTAALELPIGPTNNSSKLYAGQYNHMDFSVDDNGLWVIFPVPESNNTAVMKVDIDQMIPQYIWNVSIEHQNVGEMFIVCGVLYAVDSVTDRNTKIRFALDLYRNTLLDVQLSFSNPFRKTTMIGYNHKNKELYTWDKGNQLTYPVRYHEIGYNYTGKDEKIEMEPTALKQTGYKIY